MNLKDRIKSVSFWAGIVGAIILVLGAFGVDIGDETASAIVNAVCSLMVFLGIASAPKSADDEDEPAKNDDIDGVIVGDDDKSAD